MKTLERKRAQCTLNSGHTPLKNCQIGGGNLSRKRNLWRWKKRSMKLKTTFADNVMSHRVKKKRAMLYESNVHDITRLEGRYATFDSANRPLKTWKLPYNQDVNINGSGNGQEIYRSNRMDFTEHRLKLPAFGDIIARWTTLLEGVTTSVIFVRAWNWY